MERSIHFQHDSHREVCGDDIGKILLVRSAGRNNVHGPRRRRNRNRQGRTKTASSGKTASIGTGFRKSPGARTLHDRAAHPECSGTRRHSAGNSLPRPGGGSSAGSALRYRQHRRGSTQRGEKAAAAGEGASGNSTAGGLRRPDGRFRRHADRRIPPGGVRRVRPASEVLRGRRGATERVLAAGHAAQRNSSPGRSVPGGKRLVHGTA